MQRQRSEARTNPRPRALTRRIERVARVLGTGFMFLVFGVGAVILAAVLYPLSRLCATAERPPDRIAQRVIARAFALFIWLGCRLRLWDVEWTGSEHLQTPGALIVANHPTLIDVVLLLARIPQSDCVVKRAAWRNPALAGIVRAAGYIPNDDGHEMVEACVERLRAGRTVMLFPEGSRSPEAGLRPFRRGAAHVILRSGRPVVPVFIECDPPALKKGQRWYALPNRRLRYTLRVAKPVELRSPTLESMSDGNAARQLNSDLRAIFEQNLLQSEPAAPASTAARPCARSSTRPSTRSSERSSER